MTPWEMDALPAESTVCLIDCAASDAIELVLIEHLNGPSNIVSQKLWGWVVSDLGTQCSYLTVMMEDFSACVLLLSLWNSVLPLCCHFHFFCLTNYSVYGCRPSDPWYKCTKTLLSLCIFFFFFLNTKLVSGQLPTQNWRSQCSWREYYRWETFGRCCCFNSTITSSFPGSINFK